MNKMLIKVLGVLDIAAAVLFWLFISFNFIPSSIITILAFYLLIKGAVFVISKDITSVFDIASAGVLFLSISFTIPSIIAILVSLFLLQKGAFSLFS